MAQNKKSIYVSMPVELVEKLDEFCAQKGLSRGAFINFLVSSSLDSYEEIKAAAATAATLSNVDKMIDNAQ